MPELSIECRPSREPYPPDLHCPLVIRTTSWVTTAALDVVCRIHGNDVLIVGVCLATVARAALSRLMPRATTRGWRRCHLASGTKNLNHPLVNVNVMPKPMEVTVDYLLVGMSPPITLLRPFVGLSETDTAVMVERLHQYLLVEVRVPAQCIADFAQPLAEHFLCDDLPLLEGADGDRAVNLELTIPFI